MRRYAMRRQDGKPMFTTRGGHAGPLEWLLTSRQLWEETDNTDEQNEAIGDLGVGGVYVLDDGTDKFDVVRLQDE